MRQTIFPPFKDWPVPGGRTRTQGRQGQPSLMTGMSGHFPYNVQERRPYLVNPLKVALLRSNWALNWVYLDTSRTIHEASRRPFPPSPWINWPAGPHENLRTIVCVPKFKWHLSWHGTERVKLGHIRRGVGSS